MKRASSIHFIGIGGVSMSGIAMELARSGFKVSGSDAVNSNTYLQEIENFGQIKVFHGHKAENISKGMDIVVVTSTITEANPELVRARELGIKVLQRFEIINLIASEFKNKIGIFGGAGKTTTTALTFYLFQSAGLLPSMFLGSVLMNLRSSVHLEKNRDFCIFETDESDASFKDMSMDGGIFVAMENDHLEHKAYSGSYENMKTCFKELLAKLKGPLSFNADSADTLALMKNYKGKAKSFSIKNKKADFYAENFKFTYSGMHLDIFRNGKLFLENAFMPLIGAFNALNVLGAIAQLSFFVSDEVLKSAILNLHGFEGIDKRQIKVGKFENFDIIDDYAHSPLKIKSMLSGFMAYAKELGAGLLPVCEIHKISRLESMYDSFLTCFEDVPFLILMDVYRVPGYTYVEPDMQKFIKDVKKHNKKIEIIHVTNENLEHELWELMQKPEFKEKELNFLLFFGAGLSSKFAKIMQEKLENVRDVRRSA